MRRFTRSAAALLLVGPLAACSTTAPPVVDHYSGAFEPLSPVVLDNLTLSGGRYEISVDLEIFVHVAGPPVTVSCVIIDATGGLGPLFGTGFHAGTGEWFTATQTSTHDLPELTLGLRCYPDRPAVLELLVRTAALHAERIG